MFDELKIFITGDVSGISTAIKQAFNIVQGGVEKMNDQEVDWTSIFTRSVSPAIISGVASIFAFAISQSMQFQQAMAQTGTAAGQSSTQIAQMSQAALGLSTQVPSSAEEIASAMAKVSAVFGNSADQQQIVQAMAQLAASGFGDLNDIVSSSIGLFQEWGVTTTTQAIDVLTSLMHGAQGAKESIPELAGQFATFTPQLIESGQTLSDFNGIMSAFSATVKDLGSSQATALFTAIGSGASNANPALAAFAGGADSIRKSLKENGGLDAIKKLSDVMSSDFGNNIGLIASNLSLSAQGAEALINAGKQFPRLAADADSIAKSGQDINGAYGESNSTLRQLTLQWNELKSNVIDLGTAMSPLATALGSIFVNATTDAKNFFKDLTDGFGSALSPLFGGSFSDAIKGTFKGITSSFDDIVVAPISQAMTGLTGAITGTPLSSLNQAVAGQGFHLNSGALLSLDRTAQQTGMVDSLLSALSTGIKSGQYTSLVNTFHLNVPAGSQGLTSKMIAQQLYNQFQGTQ